jgi:predicted metal-dependent phosphoesterase TrpH
VTNTSAGFQIDFHVHTWFSYDCPMPPKLVIEVARWRGLDGIAITDHDTVSGALATMNANRHSDFLVIPGIEVKTDLGDVIGLYVEREIESRGFGDVIAEIHENGGLAYLPHPIRTFGAERSKQIHAAYPDIDLWEMYNGRYDASEFSQSRLILESLGISGPLCGSDAHFPWDIGVFRTVLEDVPRDAQELLRLSRSADLQAAPRSEISLSSGIMLGAMTKAFKRREYGKVGRYLTTLPWKTLKKSARLVFGRSR